MEKSKNNPEEMVLFVDEPAKKESENNDDMSLSSKEESLTLEEYFFECARFGELEDLKEAMKDADSNFNVNMKDFRGNTALHLACANGHLPVVKYLVENLKVDINALNNSNNTPLYWAMINNQKDIVDYLLSKGVNYDIKTAQGKSISEEAYDNKFYDISEMIIKKELDDKKDLGIKEETIEGEEEDSKEEKKENK